MKRRLLPLAVAMTVILAALFLFGGCGGETKDPKELLTEAAQNAREAGTVHAQMNVSLTPLEGEAGMGLNIQGDAWLNMQTKAIEARFTVMGIELSLRYVDSKAYLQMGEQWYSLSGEALAGVDEGTIAAVVDMLASYPDLFLSNSEVNDLGDKKVGEYDCTNLEVVPDLQSIAEQEPVRQLAADLDMPAEDIEAYLQDAKVQMEVCVQKDEPIIREVFLAADTDLPDMGQIAGISLLPSRAHVELTIDISEYGVTVEVQAPSDVSPFKGL